MTLRTLRTTLPRYLSPAVLAISLFAFGSPCAAQDADAPTVTSASHERESLFVPGFYLTAITPLRDRIALNVYGFYYGEVKVPVAQVDVPLRAMRFLTITPSYLYYEIPPSGLNKAAQRPIGATDAFEENQFRIDATAKFSVRAFEFSSRSMFVRRFRPTDDINRYRQRIGIAHPLRVNGSTWKPFATYEGFYEHENGGGERGL